MVKPMLIFQVLEGKKKAQQILALTCLSFCSTFSHTVDLFQIYANNGHSLDEKETETVLAYVTKRLK